MHTGNESMKALHNDMDDYSGISNYQHSGDIQDVQLQRGALHEYAKSNWNASPCISCSSGTYETVYPLCSMCTIG
jgi:hypothetical protein